MSTLTAALAADAGMPCEGMTVDAAALTLGPRPYRDILNAPLAAVAGGTVGQSFHAWFGTTRRRYIFTVCAPGAFDRELLDGAIVVASRGGPAGRRVVFVGEGHEVPDELAFGAAASELHYHLLAMTPAERRAVINDLTG